MKIKIILGLILIFAALQVVNPIDTDPKEIDPANSILSSDEVPDEVKTIIKKACFDCHSNETDWPWYSKIAPISWWINDHIEHGSHHLSFSKWKIYSKEEKDKKMHEIVEEIEEGEMPLYSYTILHNEAVLTEQEKERLIQFFGSH